MVVYDRENLINKFHDSHNNNNNNNSPMQIPLKSNQNGLINDNNNNNPNLIKSKTKKSFCCCIQKQSEENHPMIIHQTPSFNNNHCSNPERKPNGYLIYRFTNHHQNNNNSTNSAPNTPPSLSKSKTFCRPCTITTKKMPNLSDEVHNYRRNYLSHIGAEYQFRTGDSPCYELKTIQNSLPPLIKCRSHSFERSPTNPRRDFNTEFIHHQQLNISNDRKSVS
jgi:hypothetical protein